MRLGIRRKLIGTLMLVGLLPLALSLLIILIGGAAMRLTSIRTSYDFLSRDAANQVSISLRHEIEQLTFIARLPNTINYTREHDIANVAAFHLSASASTTVIAPEAAALDRKWPQLGENDSPLRELTHNVLADRLRIAGSVGSSKRQFLVTDSHGLLIAADHKTGDFAQSDEAWWQAAYNKGAGGEYVSTLVKNPSNGAECIEIAVPIFDDQATPQRLIGVVKEKIDASWLRNLLDVDVRGHDAIGQIYDEAQRQTVISTKDDPAAGAAAQAGYLADKAETDFTLVRQFFSHIIFGSSPVPLALNIQPQFPNAQLPEWTVIVSKPSNTALTPVYHLALTVAAIGIALILALFILGVAISNREIIMPILRLREATAAVGRGELNVRLMSEDYQDPTFRADELGQLAADFDTMTRQLQKNVSTLERSNEAKRRFMELAGHELRTPVTYILGVCQLLQRQLQAAEQSDEELHSQTPVVAKAANASAMNAALFKISAKAQRLSRIIENLLKLVNNDQFTTRLLRQPIDMRALILQVCNDNRPFLVERKQIMQLDVPENLPTLIGDRDKLEDAINNLVSNAIRFSPDGSTVKVGARKVVGDMMEIIVEDAGAGIPEADLANLFEPFYTGTDVMHHHSGTIEYGSKGIGLGLAIVRRFVEIHGGVVRAHASPQGSGRGTQFQILLPLSRDEQRLAAGESNPG